MENKLSLSIVTVLALVAIIFSVIAMKKNNISVTTQDTLAKIQSTKKMKVCYAVFPPAVIKDSKTGKVSGHDIDAITEMAQALGATVDLQETTFGNMSAAIQSGTCDIGTSLFVKIPRASAVAYSSPLSYAGNSGLARKGDTRFKSITDVDKPGINVAVATGESGDIYATAHFKNATIHRIDVESSDLARFLLEVTSGRADIGLADSITIADFAKQHPEATDVFANNTFDVNPNALPMRLGDSNFISFVDNSILYMQSSGEWASFEKKYDAHWLHEVKKYQVQ